MNYDKDLSVILPAYLEEENLRILLPRIKKKLESLNLKFEIIVVDTPTQMDGTGAACAELDGVKYLNRTGGDSYGAAIRSGIREITGRKAIFMDSDGSHHPEFIKQLYTLQNEYDVVIASRYIEGGHTENSAILVLMSKIVNWGYSFVLNIKCKDVSNSFRLYDSAQLQALQLRCENFDIVEEILFKLIRQNKNIKLKEIPFSFKQRMFGETKRNLLQFIFTYVFTLIRLRFFT
jgi:dolichol-phosphate mannosyltransferase